MILWVSSEVLVDALLPESLHEVPVLDYTMPNGKHRFIAWLVCLISNVEVLACIHVCVCVCVCVCVVGEYDDKLYASYTRICKNSQHL